MSVGEALRDLGRFLDDCEEEETVKQVELVDDGGACAGSPLTAEVEVELSGNGASEECGAVSLREARVDDGGGLLLAFESSNPVVPAGDHDVDVEVTGAKLGIDGSVRATLSASVAVEEDATAAGETTEGPDRTASGSGTPSGRDVPPFRDPDLLEEVYASCDTFAEMSEEIGMDVTAETVRRYMIDHGIHEPNSYNTTDGADDGGTASRGADPDREDAGGADSEAGDPDSSADDPEQVVLADGIGLPEEVTVETLIETVKRSNTIYEVTRNIGIERQDALEMLRELNLLDLVVGRLATEAERDINREEVIARLREASATAS